MNISLNTVQIWSPTNPGSGFNQEHYEVAKSVVLKVSVVDVACWNSRVISVLDWDPNTVVSLY